MRMTALKPVWVIVLLQTLLEATCLCPEKLLTKLTWPESGAGQNVTVRCPTGQPGQAIRPCGSDSMWGVVNYTGCSMQSLEGLYDKVNVSTIIVTDDVTAAAGDLARQTKTDLQYSGQLVLATDILIALFAKTEIDGLSQEVADIYIQDVLCTADNLLDSESLGGLWDNINRFGDAELFLTFLRELENFGEVVTAYLDSTGRSIMTIMTTTNFQSTYEVVRSDTDLTQEFEDYSTKVTIPKSALTNQGSARNTSVATLVFAFKICSLFPSQTENSRILIDVKNISSILVSCSIFPRIPPRLFNEDVTIQMKNNEVLPNSTCSYMDYKDRNSVWKEDLLGCDKPVFNEDNTVTCRCKHLTTFAVIGKHTTRGKLPEGLVVLIVVYLVLIATTFCLLLYANRKFDSDRASIVLCFLATLFIGHVTLLAGLYAIDNMDACRAVALLLHYFQLSYSFWMLAQAVQLVLKMTYKTTESGSVAQFLALGWITPLFVVAGTAGIYVEYYGRGNYCSLPLGSGISYAVIVPVALIGCTNFVCLFYAFYCYHCLKKSDKKCLAHMSRILPNIRACLIVLPLEICEWLFTSLSTEFEYVVLDVFWGLFAIALSVQILLFYGIGSSEVVEEYEKHFGPCCCHHKNSSAVRDSPRPGWRDEISQISQYREASSIMRDMDSVVTVTGNGTGAGCSGINNGGLEVDDVLAHGRELNDVSGTNHLASSLSSSFMLKTKLKVFPIRKSQQQESSATKHSQENR